MDADAPAGVDVEPDGASLIELARRADAGRLVPAMSRRCPTATHGTHGRCAAPGGPAEE
jgi:hypothetical protein